MKIEEIISLEREFKPQIDKLSINLDKMGILYDIDDFNIYFRKGDKRLAISLRYLYRQSGICSILKHVGESYVEVIKVDNSMFYDSYVKPTIDLYFK